LLPGNCRAFLATAVFREFHVVEVFQSACGTIA
jgi:hypothetical protein